MNVFHKVLLKVHEISGGKENADVDLIDLLKKEGFYSNIDNIAKQLQDEGWVTETSRKYTVRITHWGNSEAKRVLSDSPDKVNEREKESNRLLNQGGSCSFFSKSLPRGRRHRNWITLTNTFLASLNAQRRSEAIYDLNYLLIGGVLE